VSTPNTPNPLSNELTFITAQRAARVPKIALSGASGAGKTLSALMLAGGLVDAPLLPDAPATGRWSDVIVADTENGSSQLYTGLAFNYKNYRGEIATVEIGPFTHVDFKPPFEWRRWVKLIEEASKRGKCLILDTISAEWSGQGGILDFVGSLGGRANDWKSGSAAHRTVLDTILRAPIPIIALLREDQKHEIVRVPNGSGGEKVQVNKLGLKPQQREGFEYEVDLALTIDHNTHIASVGTGKDRTGPEYDNGRYRTEYRYRARNAAHFQGWHRLSLPEYLPKNFPLHRYGAHRNRTRRIRSRPDLPHSDAFHRYASRPGRH
jgi:hypothetical protein